MFYKNAKYKIITIILSTSLTAAFICPSFAEEYSPEEIAIDECNEDTSISNNSSGTKDYEDNEETISDNDAEEETKDNNYLLGTSQSHINNSGANEDSFYVTGASGRKADGAPDLSSSWLRYHSQGQSGICWIYAANNALQANIYKKGGSATNISEKNTAYYYWNTPTDKSEGHALANAHNEIEEIYDGASNILVNRRCYGTGGTTEELDGYYAAWKGLVPEEDVDDFGSENDSTYRLYSNETDVQTPNADRVYTGEIGHVQDIYHCNTGDREALKNLVRTYGAAAIGVYTYSADRTNDYPAWYHRTTYETDHAVTIIGWDDNYPKGNFPGSGPNNDGAWYCMNSTNVNAKGQTDSNGCFWLSYEDAALTDPQHVLNNVATAYNVVFPTEDNFYNHNYIGGAGGYCTEPLKDTGTEPHGICYKAEGQNNSTGHEKVQAIGFSTFEPDTRWTIKAYRGTHADESNLVSSQNEDIEYAGFHTIELDMPFLVDTDSYFYVEITPRESASIEYVVPGSNRRGTDRRDIDTTAAGTNFYGYYKGKSYFGNKYGTSYINGVEVADKQVMIHVYTFDALESGSTSRIVSKRTSYTYGDADVTFSDYCEFTPGRNDVGTHTDTIRSVTSSNTSSVIVKDDNGLTFGNVGTSKITVTTTDGVSQEIWITVAPYELTRSNVSDIRATTVERTGRFYPAEPGASVRANGRSLRVNNDYSIAYENNDTTGTAYAIITGRGNYTGTVRVPFNLIVVEWSRFTVSQNNINVNTGDTVNVFNYVAFNPGCNYQGNGWGIRNIGMIENGSWINENEYAKVIGNNITFKKAGRVEIDVQSEDNGGATLTFNITGESTPSTPTEPGNNEENNEPNVPSTPSVPTVPVSPTVPVNPSNENAESEKPVESKTIELKETVVPKKGTSTASTEFVVDVAMNKEAPYTPNTKELAKSFNVTLETKSGINLKSVKATKPKNGTTKVTIQLKGVTKEEKKAVKAMNKKLKNMVMPITPMDISKNSATVELGYKKNKQKELIFNKVKKVKIGKTTLKNKTDYTYTSETKDGKTLVTIKGKGNYTGEIVKEA